MTKKPVIVQELSDDGKTWFIDHITFKPVPDTAMQDYDRIAERMRNMKIDYVLHRVWQAGHDELGWGKLGTPMDRFQQRLQHRQLRLF